MFDLLMNPAGNILCDHAYDWDAKLSLMGWIGLDDKYKGDENLAMGLIKKAERKAWHIGCKHMKV